MLEGIPSEQLLALSAREGADLLVLGARKRTAIGRLYSRPHMAGLFIATALTFSSTAVVEKLLDQKDELHVLYGNIAVGIFLVQNIVVVVVLTFLAGLGSPDEQLSTAECVTANGCSTANTCAGTPPACESLTSAPGCVMVSGCLWGGTACSGSPDPCSSYLASVTCEAVDGCDWSACIGTPASCDTLDEAACDEQPGCTFE